MASQNFENLVAAAGVATPAAISASTTETLLFPNYLVAATPASAQSPIGPLYPGTIWRINAFGVYTSAAATQGTLGFKIHMGANGTNADLVVCGSPLITVPASGSNTGWSLEAYLQVVLLGSSGNTVIGNGRALVATVTSGVPLVYSLHGAAGATAPAAVAVNTTIANNIGVYAVFSSATTNTIQCFQATIEQLN